jgi:RHS repeat-associated protein
MGDNQVATIRPNGSSVSVYYVHADHLSTPKMVTQPSSNKIAWRWDQDPFGTAAPNQNPAGLGTFVYNLRFPGQYYDTETGLNYNYFRDYDPQVGRYVESDPVSVGAHVATAISRLTASSRTVTTDVIQDALMVSAGSVVAMAARNLSEPIELNPYAYALKNPISHADPSGLSPSGSNPGDPSMCPLVAQVLLGLEWGPPVLSQWLCVYDCNTTCPPKASRYITEIQTAIFPRFGCVSVYPRPWGLL